MMKRSFAGLTTPHFEYTRLPTQIPQPIDIPDSKRITLFISAPETSDPTLALKIGDLVKTAQKVKLYADPDISFISTVTGMIEAITPFQGNYGQRLTAISIATESKEDLDTEFVQALAEPNLSSAIAFLSNVPGAPPLHLFANPEKPIHTIIIYGCDSDLLLATGQYAIQTRLPEIKVGINALKEITGVEKIFLAMPLESMQGYGHIGAEVKFVDHEYPAAFPQLVMHKALGREIPAGKQCEDMGVCFMRAEAVASLGFIFERNEMPVHKILTVVDKNNRTVLVNTRIGTPIHALLEALDIQVEAKDRIILGGPMTGFTVYSETYPVQADTDAIIVQGHSDIVFTSNAACINCGECIRICPANVPINMLIRYLEKDEFELAADEYDLLSCIECGLCSYVCVAQIPILQHIRLAKFELARANTSENTENTETTETVDE